MRKKSIKVSSLIILSAILIICFSGMMPNSEISWILQKFGETVTDYDGNVYSAIRIGDQVWMAENLKVRHYNDGSVIPNVREESEWSVLRQGAFCLDYTDAEKHSEIYGLLYNFYAVSDNRSICPDGWRIPTADDWHELVQFLGGVKTAGAKMKDTESGCWVLNRNESLNESGFSALPAGGRGRLGDVSDIGYYATWWSSTSSDSLYAWHWGLFPDSTGIRFNPGHKASGFSVRLIKNK